jgi:symplekin
MLAIKSNILRRMDGAPPGLRICCVKFLQQVVLVQTPGMPPDPRVNTVLPTFNRQPFLPVSQRPEQIDISLALVPRDHPLIPYANLEAESSGLLDRLLGIIHGDHRLDRPIAGDGIVLTGYSDALLVTATLNSLGMLVQRRPVVTNKIMASVLNFNSLKLANSPMTSKNKVIMKSMERTTRALLVNVMKRYDLCSYDTGDTAKPHVETLKVPLLDAYNNIWSVCIACDLMCLMTLTARDLLPLNLSMVWIQQRGND